MRIGPGSSHETPIMLKFAALRRLLSASPAPSLADVGVNVVIEPFVDLIRGGGAGPVIGAALSALDKFLSYQLVRPRPLGRRGGAGADALRQINADLPDSNVAMATVAETVTHCKFEATDSVADEVVLMKLLHVRAAAAARARPRADRPRCCGLACSTRRAFT